MSALLIVIGIALGILILLRPYLGIVLITASLPVIDILPAIPVLSSVFPLFGGLTLAGFLLSKLGKLDRSLFHLGSIHILGLVFIVWIFITNPEAAWFGVDRNWVLTFIQLWILVWLTGEILDTPQKHRYLIWAYAIATAASALFAILKQGNIGAGIDTSARAFGLAEGSNIAARYFVVGLVFFNYLRSVANQRLPRLLAILGMLVTFFGVFFTVSRTGILLLFSAFSLLIVLQSQRKYQIQLMLFLVVGLIGLWLVSDNITNIMRSIVPSISQGTDTVGLRYKLWQAGWRMWLDHPIQGVGIGMYRVELINYVQGVLSPRLSHVVAHNMYVAILAETGLIGIILFITLLILTLKNFWQAGRITDWQFLPFRNVWLIAFLIMLLGGLTKTDQTDKLIWLGMGVSVYFQKQTNMEIIENKDDVLVDNARQKFQPDYPL